MTPCSWKAGGGGTLRVRACSAGRTAFHPIHQAILIDARSASHHSRPKLILVAVSAFGKLAEMPGQLRWGAKRPSQLEGHYATASVGRNGSSPTLAFVEAEATARGPPE